MSKFTERLRKDDDLSARIEAVDIIDEMEIAAELAYSEMAFTLHDILDPRRRGDGESWIERRGKSLAESVDRLFNALERLK